MVDVANVVVAGVAATDDTGTEDTAAAAEVADVTNVVPAVVDFASASPVVLAAAAPGPATDVVREPLST